jgi:hypothetical protein
LQGITFESFHSISCGDHAESESDDDNSESGAPVDAHQTQLESGINDAGNVGLRILNAAVERGQEREKDREEVGVMRSTKSISDSTNDSYDPTTATCTLESLNTYVEKNLTESTNQLTASSNGPSVVKNINTNNDSNKGVDVGLNQVIGGSRSADVDRCLDPCLNLDQDGRQSQLKTVRLKPLSQQKNHHHQKGSQLTILQRQSLAVTPT